MTSYLKSVKHFFLWFQLLVLQLKEQVQAYVMLHNEKLSVLVQDQ